jgi:hypothetical protein
MVLGIHQPNVMPWPGYFNKIHRVDTFVFLDHVTVNIKTPNWLKKVFISNNGRQFPVSLPLKKGESGSFQKINEIQVDVSNPQWKKLGKTIAQFYAKHPYYDEYKHLSERYFSNEEESLAAKNITFIKELLELLQIDTELVLSSELNPSSNSNEMLIEIIKHFGGNEYLSGDGADGYQNEDLYKSEGLVLSTQNFKQPSYAQFNSSEFLGGLSMLDMLFNIGANESILKVKGK